MSSTSTYPEASTVDGEKEPTISIPNGLKVEENSRDSSADDNRIRGEDIFLNIARSNASNRDSAGKADRRRVSNNTSFQRRSLFHFMIFPHAPYYHKIKIIYSTKANGVLNI
jgi:hypothetical protein